VYKLLNAVLYYEITVRFEYFLKEILNAVLTAGLKKSLKEFLTALLHALFKGDCISLLCIVKV